jgi:hypothetical protein
MTDDSNDPRIRYDFGTFDGGCWPTEYLDLWQLVTASEILSWREDKYGEAVFWPTGDKPEMTLLFDEESRKIERHGQLLALVKLLDHLGGDAAENYLRIRHAMNWLEVDICELPKRVLDVLQVHIFVGTELAKVEEQAVAELAVRYRDIGWDGPATEAGVFLDKYRNDPAWGLETVTFGDKVAVLVWPTARRFSDPIPSRK